MRLINGGTATVGGGHAVAAEIRQNMGVPFLSTRNGGTAMKLKIGDGTSIIVK
jgi:hypothetical protein